MDGRVMEVVILILAALSAFGIFPALEIMAVIAAPDPAARRGRRNCGAARVQTARRGLACLGLGWGPAVPHPAHHVLDIIGFALGQENERRGRRKSVPGNARRNKPLEARRLDLDELDALGIPRSELVISPASARKSRPTPASGTSLHQVDRRHPSPKAARPEERRFSR